MVPEQWAAAAALALQRLENEQGDTGLLHEVPSSDGGPAERAAPRFAHLWPYSQVVMGGLLLAGRRSGAQADDPGPARRLAALEHYWNPEVAAYLPVADPPGPASGDLYYDDNAWVGLALLQWSRMRTARPALVRAARVFSLLAGGFDRDPSKPAPGGIPWTRAPGETTRNTCSNGPSAELGAGLYLATGEPRFLEWARALEHWTTTALLGEDGLYRDHLLLDGSFEETRWSYNQGSMIAANALLHRATGDPGYLERARGVAAASLAHYSGGRLMAQPTEFNAIFLRGLLVLAATRPDDSLHRLLLRYAEDLYTEQLDYKERLDPTSGRVIGRAQESSVLHQAGVIEVLALAAWPASRHHLLV